MLSDPGETVIELTQIRDLLLPGLLSVRGTYNFEAGWATLFAEEAAAAAPIISLPVALAMGATAVLIKNPPVTRRFWK